MVSIRYRPPQKMGSNSAKLQLWGGGRISGRTRVEGLAEINKTLLSIGGVPATDAGREALWLATRPLAETIAAAAPEADGGPTTKSWTGGRGLKMRRGGAFYGSLRENIRRGVVVNSPNGTVMAQVGTGNAFWGLFTEKGTANRRTKRSAANRGRVTGINWMARAFQQGVPQALAQVRVRLEVAIANAARKKGRGTSGIPGIWRKVVKP